MIVFAGLLLSQTWAPIQGGGWRNESGSVLGYTELDVSCADVRVSERVSHFCEWWHLSKEYKDSKNVLAFAERSNKFLIRGLWRGKWLVADMIGPDWRKQISTFPVRDIQVISTLVPNSPALNAQSKFQCRNGTRIVVPLPWFFEEDVTFEEPEGLDDTLMRRGAKGFVTIRDLSGLKRSTQLRVLGYSGYSSKLLETGYEIRNEIREGKKLLWNRARIVSASGFVLALEEENVDQRISDAVNELAKNMKEQLIHSSARFQRDLGNK